MSRVRYASIAFGPLPVEMINATLGTELPPGNVRLSSQAHFHIARDHPADYSICFPEIAKAIASPSFIGQAPEHGTAFEVIRRIGRTDGKVVLVAICLELDDYNEYRIHSSYLISEKNLEARRQMKRLKIPRRL